MQFTIANTARTTTATNTRTSRNPFTNRNARLWTAQVVVGAIFVMSGIMKLTWSAEQASADSGLPEAFFYFIGLCEIAGGLGLVLPHLLNIARPLTAIAAIGLGIIMIGAVVVSLIFVGPVAVPAPILTGLACAYIARGRFEGVPFFSRSR